MENSGTISMWITMMLMLGLGIYFLALLKRCHKPSPASKARKVSNHSLPLVRRSYLNGLERPESATEEDSNESTGDDVKFAEGSPSEDTRAELLPAWEGLRSGPVFVLGTPRDDGMPVEYIVTPPEIVPVKRILKRAGLVDEFPDELEPSINDLTDEEKLAIDEFDVRTFL